MKTTQFLVSAVWLASAIIGTGELAEAAPSAAASTPVLTDEKSIEGVLRKQFDKPQTPLQVLAIAIEGEYAVAGWIQDRQGGRALLKKEKGQWSIEVCAGDGLAQPATLAMTGMTQSAASRLAEKVKLSEKRLSAQQVRMFGLFKGVVQVNGAAHGAHP